MGPKKAPQKKSSRRGTHSHAEGMGALARDLLKFLQAQPNFHFQSGRAFDAADLSEAQAQGKRVMIALPPDRAAELLSPAHPELARVLRNVEVNSVATLTAIWPSAVGETGLPAGFGVLFPRGEGIEALGVLRNHHIFEGRSDRVSETWIYSGASLRVRGIWDNSEGLKALIEEERFRLTGKRLAPEHFASYFWDKGIPHYTVQLEKLLPEVERLAALAEVEVFGNYTGHLGLTRIFAEAKRRVHEGFGNV